MAEVIAQIKLAPGQIGYYDEYSRVHLTMGNPVANIYSGTNCSQLRRSVRSGRIILVSGTLGEHVPPFKVITNPNGGFILASNAAEEHKPVMSLVKPKKDNMQTEEVTEVNEEVISEEEKVVEEPIEATDETVTEEENKETKNNKVNKRKKTAPKK